MMVILNQTEMEEAVRDWCKRHGIPVEGKASSLQGSHPEQYREPPKGCSQ